MGEVLKEVSVSSILIAVVGLVLLIMPNLTNRIIVYGIGAVLVVYGIGRIFRYIRRSADYGVMEHDLSVGLVCVVSGLFMILYSAVVISVLPFLFGLALIFGGAMSVQTAFDVRRFHGARWTMHLVIGIAFVLAGVEAIRNPFGAASLLTRFVGLCFLLLGIYTYIENKKVTELRRAFRESPDIIDEEDIKKG
jgi:uncharacterized membrane protein HdeD (DUF308 family)